MQKIPHCYIGAQCGASGQCSQAKNVNYSKKPITVTSILRVSKSAIPKSVSFQGGDYTKVYYAFEPASQLNYPYTRPADFYFPRKGAREDIPWVPSIKVPYTIGPYGVRKEIPKPRPPGGRGRVLEAKIKAIRLEEQRQKVWATQLKCLTWEMSVPWLDA